MAGFNLNKYVPDRDDEDVIQQMMAEQAHLDNLEEGADKEKEKPEPETNESEDAMATDSTTQDTQEPEAKEPEAEPEKPELIGDHADLFEYNEETGEYEPKDDDAALQIQTLGENLDIRRLDQKAGAYMPMTYNLWRKAFTPVQGMPADGPSTKGTKGESPEAEAPDEGRAEKRTVKRSDIESTSATDSLVDSAVYAATRGLDVVWAQVEKAARLGGRLTMDGAKGIVNAVSEYRNSEKADKKERPAPQAQAMADDIEKDIAGNPDLDEANEVSAKAPPKGAVTDKLKQQQDSNSGWAEKHTQALRDGVLGSMATVSAALALDEAESKPSTPDEMEAYIQKLPEDRKQQVEDARAKIAETLDSAKRGVESWVGGKGPKSLIGLNDTSPEEAAAAQKHLNDMYDEIQGKGKEDKNNLWDTLKIGEEGVPLSQAFGNVFKGLGDALKGIAARLSFSRNPGADSAAAPAGPKAG